MATVTLYWRGPCAYLNWRIGGKRLRRTLGKLDRQAAEKIRSQKEAELTHGVRIIPRLPEAGAYLKWYLDQYAATHPTTVSKARSELRRFISQFGHRPIDTIEPTEIDEYITARFIKDKAAPETVGKEIRRLKAAFNKGVALKRLDSNPVAKVSAPRGVRSVAVRYYDKKALAKLYKASGERAPLWQFMVHTGLRRGEMVKMRHADVVRGKLQVESVPNARGAGRTKSGKWRPIPLNSKAIAALESLPDPPVTVHPDTLSDWFALDAAAAKIGGSLHRLRHTFGANLTMAGVPLRRVQELMGHTDYATTEKYYAHLSSDGAGTAVKLLEKLL